MNSVLVTGGTGFVGCHVTAALAAQGYRARLLVRDPASPRARQLAADCGADLRPGDLQEADAVIEAARGVDAVIHLVGIICEIGRQRFASVHETGTRYVVQAAQRARVPRFIHMSALGTRPGAVSRYHQSKWNAEETVRQSGLDWTIFRPSLIYGPGDAFVNAFARMARYSPVLPVIGDGHARMQPVSVELVAAAFGHALADSRSIGQTLDLCGPAPMSFERLLDAIGEVSGRRRRKLHLPVWVARMQATVHEWFFARLLRLPPPITRDQVIMLQEDNVGDPEPVANLFGLRDPTFREGIAKLLARISHQRNPDEKQNRSVGP